MGGSALKVAPQINLDEFERRLRAAGSSSTSPEDPLDQLARLVGLDVSAPAPGAADRSIGLASSAEAPQPVQIRLPHIDEAADDGQGFDAAHYEERHEVYDEAAADTLENAPLRGAIEHEDSDEPLAPQAQHSHARPLYPQGLAPPAEAIYAARRSSRIPLTIGLLVGVGAVGLVGAWAIKGAPGLPRTPPIIMAADGPTKVQPPSQDTVASPSDSAAILMKDQAGKPGPVKLVSSEEQPVDLQQQQDKSQPVTRSLAPLAVTPPPAVATPPAVASAPVVATPAVATPSSPAPSAPTAPASPAPAAALTTVGPTNAAPAAPAAFPEPKRVKTVSVRPDGSVISSASAAVADASPATAAAPADADAMPQPANPPVPRARPTFDSNSAAAQPATPKLDLPPKPSVKSAARVPIAKIDTTVAGGANQSPEAAAPAPAQAPPTPLQLVPSLLERAVKAVGGQSQTQVAAADPVATSTTPAAGGGAYAVQLAAPGSEQEAKSVSARLQSKYASELAGMQPSIHQADVNGKPLYRVRLGGLSKADAVSLCMKLKASGGDSACFVAKN